MDACFCLRCRSRPIKFPVLETERLVLREIVSSDAEDLFAFRSDAEEQEYNGGPLISRGEADQLIRELAVKFRDESSLHWGLTLREEGRVVGLFGYSNLSLEHRRSEVGYDLARSLWGNGYALEAMRAVLRHGFETMNLNRIYAVPRSDNLSSVKLLERLGFKLEGVHRDEFFFDGVFRDESLFALLKRDSEYAGV